MVPESSSRKLRHGDDPWGNMSSTPFFPLLEQNERKISRQQILTQRDPNFNAVIQLGKRYDYRHA